MGFTFKKMFIGEIVSSNGGIVFRKLSTTPPKRKSIQIDLSALGLPAGEYTITVTASAAGLISEHSNAVTYTVK